MRNLWRVAVYEYERNVFKKSFLITLLSLPFLIGFSIGTGLILETQIGGNQPVGIVDHSGVLGAEPVSAEVSQAWAASIDDPIAFNAYPDEQAARAALDSGRIQAFFILPESYPETRSVEVVYLKEPGQKAWMQLYAMLRVHLMPEGSPQIASRLASGLFFMVRSMDGRREVPASSGPTFKLMMPLFTALAFLVMLLMSSGYTMSAVAEEKENRTMEVLVTTISPGQILGGKILGVAAISLTLMSAWTGVILLGILLSRLAGLSWFNDLSMDWWSVVNVVIIGIPAYVLATALMIGIGALVSTTQEGQSVSGVFFALHMVPLYITFLFLNEPHSPLAVALSMLPFTALITVAMRNMFTIVPFWQVAVSAVVQVLFACGAIWLAGRAFRIGMLRYGQRLSLRHLLARG